MSSVWDYDEKAISKYESGKILILERIINYGTPDNRKISLTEVKRSWNKLDLLPLRKRLFKLLIWGK